MSVFEYIRTCFNRVLTTFKVAFVSTTVFPLNGYLSIEQKLALVFSHLFGCLTGQLIGWSVTWLVGWLVGFYTVDTD